MIDVTSGPIPSGAIGIPVNACDGRLWTPGPPGAPQCGPCVAANLFWGV